MPNAFITVRAEILIKTMPNAFITVKKLHRYGPVISYSQRNLKPGNNMDIRSLFILILKSEVTHLGPATCHFQVLDIAVMAAPMRIAVLLPEQLFLSVCIIKEHNKY